MTSGNSPSSLFIRLQQNPNESQALHRDGVWDPSLTRSFKWFLASSTKSNCLSRDVHRLLFLLQDWFEVISFKKTSVKREIIWIPDGNIGIVLKLSGNFEIIWKYLDIFENIWKVWGHLELSEQFWNRPEVNIRIVLKLSVNFEIIWNYPEICFKNSLESRRSYGSIRTVLEPFNKIQIIWNNVWKVSNHPGRSNSIQRVLKVSGQFGRFFYNIRKKFRMRHNFPGSNASLPIRFLCLCPKPSLKLHLQIIFCWASENDSRGIICTFPRCTNFLKGLIIYFLSAPFSFLHKYVKHGHSTRKRRSSILAMIFDVFVITVRWSRNWSGLR